MAAAKDSLRIWILFLAVLVGSVNSLGYTPAVLTRAVRRNQKTLTTLSGWFDFNPIHGGGSGGNDDFLDEQWEAQQAILRARRGEGQVKENLKEKYKGKQQFEVKASVPAPKAEPAMYFADESKPKTTPVAKKPITPTKVQPFKFPWDK